MNRVFLVDDHPTLRQGLALLVEKIGDYEVCGEAASAAEALDAIPHAAADLVITDISLPDRNGLELIKDLRALLPSLNILVFSMHDEMMYAERSLRAGARGYLMKGAKTPVLFEAIKQVTAGEISLGDRVTSQLLTDFSSARAVRQKLDSLSDRELEIFELIGHSKNSAQIAEQLNISPKTVDAHRSNIKTKLGLSDSPSLNREATHWVDSSLKQDKSP